MIPTALPYRLGRNPSPPRDLRRRLFLRSYDKGLPEPPPVVNGYRRLSHLTMAANDQFGDCVFAAAAHLRQVWTANESEEVIVPDSVVTQDYFNYTGGSDSGANISDVLKLWQQRGVCGGKIGPYVAVHPDDPREVMQAIAIFGGVFCGMSLPQGWFDDLSHWGRGNTGRYIVGGHAIVICSYDQTKRQFGVYTWAHVVPMDFDVLADYFDELSAILSPDWCTDGTAPNGLNSEALKKDIELIGA
jgi:hypothetical protein